MEGLNYTISKTSGDTIFSEYLRILKTGEDIFFMSKVDHNQYPVAFKLIDLNNLTAIFENEKHDFPQKIIYNFSKKDTMQAAIEGINSKTGEFKRVEFIFDKVTEK